MVKTLIFMAALGAASSVFGAAVGPGPAPCTPGVITSYEALGSTGCTVDGVTFYSFSVLTDYDSGGGAIDPALRFTISPSGTGAAGFDLSFAGTTSDLIYYDIQYSFDPPPAIGSAFLGLDVEGSVNITEGICPGGVFTQGPDSTNTCNDNGLDPPAVVLGVSNTPGDTTAYATFTPVTQGQIRLLVTLDGTTSQGAAGFNTLTATVGTPEPATFGLLLAGLAALGAAAYRRKIRR